MPSAIGILQRILETNSRSNQSLAMEAMDTSPNLASKLSKNIAYYYVAKDIWQWGSKIYRAHSQTKSYRIVVDERDPLYRIVQTWLYSLIKSENRRIVRVSTGRDSYAPSAIRFSDSSESAPTESITTEIIYEDDLSQEITLEGHKIIVSSESRSQKLDNNSFSIKTEINLVFHVTSAEAQQALVRKFKELQEEDKALRSTKKKNPALVLCNSWGSWDHHSDVPRRPLETVILKDGLLESIVDDLDRFLKDEKRYVDRAIPWHRGYLFYGPPGTGKTSLARALASHFDMDLWHFPLGDVKSDTNLLTMMAEIQPRSILLLEDIDVYHAATEREESLNSSASLSGLLNALDGVTTPHGLIVLMTTNNIDALDPSLIREGRIDKLIKIDYVDADQITRMYKLFYDREPKSPFFLNEDSEVKGSSIFEILKTHLDDPNKAEHLIHNLVDNSVDKLLLA